MSLVINKTLNFQIRDSLKKSPFEIFAIMKEKGWFFDFKPPSSNRRGYISFSKEYGWNGLAQLGLLDQSYGYPIKEVSDVNYTVQRAAELCLRIYECFTDSIPGSPNIHGEIKEHFTFKNSPHLRIQYDEFIEKHKDKQFTFYESSPWLVDAFHFSYYGTVITIKKSDAKKLISEIDHALKAFDGHYPLLF